MVRTMMVTITLANCVLHMATLATDKNTYYGPPQERFESTYFTPARGDTNATNRGTRRIFVGERKTGTLSINESKIYYTLCWNVARLSWISVSLI